MGGFSGATKSGARGNPRAIGGAQPRRGEHRTGPMRQHEMKGEGSMSKANALHHLAITTADIKKQIEFFSDMLGMELVALYWMHGVEGAWHGFLKLNDDSSIAFVQTPDVGKIPPQVGVTHSGNPGAPSAPGTMQHLALNVDTEAE